jgi:vacuolar-type H+-ATPase subunit F/Vma7
MSVRAVGLPLACAGFALAGIPTHEVRSARDGALALPDIASRDDVVVLLVEQSVLDALSPAASRDLMRRPTPIVVPFPGPSWEVSGAPPESGVLELLQRAIGYRVRLR